jgi:integral membrane protein (TIGR01906 family)
LKITGIIRRLVLILCVPVLLLSASIAWGFNSLWIYQLGFNKYHVGQATGLSDAELDQAGRTMITYWNNSQDLVQITVSRNGAPFNLFTLDEQLHLKDVKALVWLDYKVLGVSFILALALVLLSVFWRSGRYRRWLAKSLLWGCGVSLILILVMGIGTLVDFNQLFLDFHFLAFSNDFWSAPGFMIALFGDLWYDAVLIGTGFMAGLAILLAAASAIYLWRTK